MTKHIIYGGDAQNLRELCYGYIFTTDMLHEAMGKVYDGRHKVKIYLPKENMETFQSEDFFYLKPVEVLFDKDLKLFKAYGIEFAKIKITYNKPQKIVKELYYVTTKVVCGENLCKIYTTIL